jgi:hypothetical protein
MNLLSRAVEGIGPVKPGNLKAEVFAFYGAKSYRSSPIWKIRGGTDT